MLTIMNLRKPQKQSIEPDQLQDFILANIIKDFNKLEKAKKCLTSFQFKWMEDYILIIYRTNFVWETNFPSVKECISIDRNFQVK